MKDTEHYTAGGIEVVDIIKAKLTEEQFKGFILGNIIKYTLRANHKGQFSSDLEKAYDYLGYLLKQNETAILQQRNSIKTDGQQT